jgi:hypothetical protein
MRSIFIKELRENALWATLLALALGVALNLALTANIESFAGITVTSTTMFGFSATGLGFGLLIIFQDQRRGRWAFLTHRPISRSRVFWAKVLAGITLHLLATGIPFLIAIWWVATPGHKP